jgi:methyl-accepting chemotaxis protein
MVRPLHQLVQGLRESDLSRRIAVASLDEIGQAADAFNEYNAKIRSMVVTLGGYTDRLASGATELAATTEQLSATTTEISTGAEQQRVATTQASATLRKVSASIGDVSERVEVANGLSKGSLDMAADGMASARACTQIMGAIQESSSKVSRITHIIANIARQTNLLSLNAAIEAAKAGNQGKGFAVVADEIRKLAERSAGAAKDIADLIQVSSDRVAEGVASAEGVGTCLASIEANIRERADGVVIIAAAMKEDANASRELADTVGFVAGQTERSASATHELSATILEIARTTEELSAMANQLRSLTAQFQV